MNYRFLDQYLDALGIADKSSAYDAICVKEQMDVKNMLVSLIAEGEKRKNPGFKGFSSKQDQFIRDAFDLCAAYDYDVNFWDAKFDELIFELAHNYHSKTLSTVGILEIDLTNMRNISQALDPAANGMSDHPDVQRCIKSVLNIIFEELREYGAQIVPVRNGIDEFRLYITGNINQAQIQSATAKAQERIEHFSEEMGLSRIKHSKYADKPARTGFGAGIGCVMIKQNYNYRDTQQLLDTKIEKSKLEQGRKRLQRAIEKENNNPLNPEDYLKLYHPAKILDEKFSSIANPRPVASAKISSDFLDARDRFPRDLPIGEWRSTLMKMVADHDGLDPEPAYFLIDNLHNMKNPQSGLLSNINFVSDLKRVTNQFKYSKHEGVAHTISCNVVNWTGMLRELGIVQTRSLVEKIGGIFHEVMQEHFKDRLTGAYDDSGALRAIVSYANEAQLQAALDDFTGRVTDEINNRPLREVLGSVPADFPYDTVGEIPNRDKAHKGVAIINQSVYTITKESNYRDHYHAILATSGQGKAKQTVATML